jgi:hypothetical protein
MDAKYERAMVRFSGVCLLGGGSLIALGVAGYTPSALLVVGAIAAGVGLYAARVRANIETLAWLWAGPLVAAGVMLVGWGATPGELQSLGGVVGLVGMVNLLLRPVYHYTIAAARALNQIRREIKEERRQEAEAPDGGADGGDGSGDPQDGTTGGFSFDQK